MNIFLHQPDGVAVHHDETKQEDAETHQSCRDQQPGVVAQPREVNSNLLTKVQAVDTYEINKKVNDGFINVYI